MAGSYIVQFAVPATAIRRARSGSYRRTTLFFAYEEILSLLAKRSQIGAVYAVFRTSPSGLPHGDPLLTVRRDQDGSVTQSGPLALPLRDGPRTSCPGCSSETGICFHRVSPAQSDIYRGGRRIGEIATMADAGAPDGALYSVALFSSPVAQFDVCDPSELLPRIVERVLANPNFV